MKGNTKGKAPLVVAFVAALGVTLAASPALAKNATWCPEHARATCERPKPDKPPVKAPKQAKPKIQPTPTKDAYGNTAYRSGNSLMT